jgi:hypothetical protein
VLWREESDEKAGKSVSCISRNPPGEREVKARVKRVVQAVGEGQETRRRPWMRSKACL